ncbi:MAG: T9SS type A sorting domain-containing protein [Taibaiella sp.]|nr:T9SS type A sorting domain-containing protein [Taibaiella sp.]
MRTTLLVFLFLVGVVSHTLAQITLTAAGYPAILTGSDSLRITTHSSPFPMLLPATAATWDMNTLTDTIPVFFASRVPVPVYQYADSNQYRMGTFGYQGNAPASVTSLGVYEYGVNTKNAIFNLFSITGVSSDTFFIPTQNTMYTAPLVKIAFPAAHSSSWQSVYQHEVGFELSVGAYSLLHEPGFRRRYTQRKDTVTGWGQMRVKNADGSPSAFFDVLQVQTTTYTTDSFYMSGSVAPSHIVTLLSFTQGKQDTTYIQRYYRAGEVTPLAEVVYKDAAFTQPAKATTHIQRLQPVATISVPVNKHFSLYPNPVTSGILRIVLPSATGIYAYSVSDVTGHMVHSGILPNGNTDCTLTLPHHMASGSYYMHILQNGMPICTSAFTVSE